MSKRALVIGGIVTTFYAKGFQQKDEQLIPINFQMPDFSSSTIEENLPLSNHLTG